MPFRRPPLLKTLLALAAFAVLLGLGTWQVQRLAWKEALIAKIEMQMQKTPASLPLKIDDPVALEFMPVHVTGRYLHDREMLLKPRTENGRMGYHVITPLREKSGRAILINRGFADDVTLKNFPRPNAEVTIDGIVSLPHKNAFTPDNDAEGNHWYWADIAAMTKGFPGAAPVMITEGKSAPEIRNDHRQYAFFWFTMAAILLSVFILSERNRKDG